MSEANTTTNHRPVPSTATMKGLPDYLRALLASDAPSAQAKLLAAWDGYSVETQILILADFHAREAYVPLELAEKALASPNAYVRHLAATAIDPIAWHEATSDTEVFSLLERIRNDPDPLARCAPSHWQRGQEDKPTAEDLDAFLALPFPERCASLGAWALGAAGPVPSAFSLLLHRAVETHALSEHELVEMVHEYLAAPKNTEFTREPPYDGFDDLLASQALDTLWNLVPDMPHPVAVALIQRLPISTGGLLGGEAPEELASM